MTCPHTFEDRLDSVETRGYCPLCTSLEFAVLQKRHEILTEKANNLARLVEQVAYAPVAGYYEQKGNDAPLRLLRMAVESIDAETSRKQ